ncbi:RNA 2',3'-cyclic phosphodiesterase [Anaerotignum lactatifermentans]|uniref:RNA 2',3'-cyclic phosphodiesterase n=1 Tax=Anaerotignum lactatifermentans TaxID=160404 RepID=A0ABS2GEF2_9FIRM|nr:RNA 2',3'-cyclic phosphodiesterase [Anaerotignum lactatifermentans]MBM6830345.1 RNA 2',3'-cyclic phosphodiesterase [Anaerotignum lactatifermentans]MBM6878869.1 RNA 2',3'-cyclic phosphodiesterase [Anaerotignum lactatifermentans]MBM6951905.1 RNA 2',3'-cyclic phosphodiesterase [Anaerotignum lactatifermentans]
MRTFIAIELEDEVKDSLEGAQNKAAELCRKGNYTPRDNFHLTLHFLGEITPEDVEYVCQAMMETTKFQRAFDLTLDRIGFFPRGREGVLWAGVEKSSELMRLFQSLEKNLGKQGFAREKKGLSPHITLGREVEPYHGFSDVQKKVELEKKTVRVTGISLMESVRMGRKLIYRPLFRQRLRMEKNTAR